MSRERFILNVRQGAVWAFPKHDPDDRTGLALALKEGMSRAGCWLERHTVEGYREQDFPELDATKLASLSTAVQSFNELAVQVPKDGDVRHKN